ncbi:hypothetical protein [Cryobacterium sp. M96]|uniref:hypothetical protein n=1 Tax=Cryobacterium sp. M96 TaxID=2048295 RepID=UPI0011B0CA63|nr:hypothetical protein [Cryobacterium sp. M96]
MENPKKKLPIEIPSSARPCCAILSKMASDAQAETKRLKQQIVELDYSVTVGACFGRPLFLRWRSSAHASGVATIGVALGLLTGRRMGVPALRQGCALGKVVVTPQGSKPAT